MLQKPSKKSFTDSAVQAVAMGLGFKVADGVAAVMPDSVSGYKSWIVMGLGLVLAASINTKTTAGSAAQAAALGMAGNGFYNGVTEVIAPSVAIKNAEELKTATITERFVQAAVHGSLGSAYSNGLGNTVQWQPDYEISQGNSWERPEYQPENVVNIALV